MIERIIHIANGIEAVIKEYLTAHPSSIDKYDVLVLDENGGCLIKRGVINQDNDYYLLSFLQIGEDEDWEIDYCHIIDVVCQYYGLE